MSETVISSARIPFLVQLAEGRECWLWFRAASRWMGQLGWMEHTTSSRAAHEGWWGKGPTCDPLEDRHSPCCGSRGSTTLEATLSTAGDSR